MYEIYTSNKKTRKKILSYMKKRNIVIDKLKKLKENPRRKDLDAHQLKGIFKGYWSCSLNGNIRLMYVIDEKNKIIKTVRIGTHKIYS
tara:strand:- start:195 stop:458 length:264 start_codon:yes stop_codon:yes gene_type:complete